MYNALFTRYWLQLTSETLETKLYDVVIQVKGCAKKS